ncbi:aldo/keto reductase [Corynebacterium freiburgense]|uniref:aldo/keto reductase n=1 Tax=Corynebacterium freiburgense TaxID=556548 RepID=UPI00040E696A|nr:aldo/keto reductase [Corynebacterium freiburgense]WJZ03441.1 General stress protein 69 [Corynebacterium freiburgense]
MNIPKIHLGNGLQVSAIGFGGMALSHVYGGIEESDAEQTLEKVIDMGITFIDTADVYGKPQAHTTGPAGTNELLIGRVLRKLPGRRNHIQLATKFGITGALAGKSANQVRGDRDYIHQCCEASLRRLGIEHIDLYYMHRRDLSRPIEETVAAMAELVDKGKVRHLGLSEVTAEELRAAAKIHPIAAVQSEWSLWSRDVEVHIVPAARELGTGFVPYAPLGRGFLTGTLTKADIQNSMRAGQARFEEFFDANRAALAAIEQVAAELGATPAQIALAWLRTQGELLGLPVVPIPGSRKAHRMSENVGSLDITLSPTHMHQLDKVAQLIYGGRNLTYNGPTWISSGRE